MTELLVAMGLAAGFVAAHASPFAERTLRNVGLDYSGLIFAALITLAHFSVRRL